jgi:hypothetical protein
MKKIEEQDRANLTKVLDEGICNQVLLLIENGIETVESCQGGEGHAYAEPTVRFAGERAEGFRALAVAMEHGLPVSELRRVWQVIDGEPQGAWWDLVFHPTKV